MVRARFFVSPSRRASSSPIVRARGGDRSDGAPRIVRIARLAGW